MKKFGLATAHRIYKNFVFKSLAAAMFVASGTSHATIMVYTDQASFLASVSNPGVDLFNGFSIDRETPGTITRIAGDFGYSADVSSGGGFWGAGTTANPFLSTNMAEHTIRFFNFIGGVAGLGGNFFASYVSGMFRDGAILLTATDASGTVNYILDKATMTSFVGFVSSTGSLTSATLSAVQPNSDYLWPTADNLTLAATLAQQQPQPVSEPETFGLILASLAFMRYFSRRRRC